MTLDIDLDISYVKIYRDMSVVIQLQARAARSAQSLSGRADAEARPIRRFDRPSALSTGTSQIFRIGKGGD
jgi:hypothetical protein